MINYIHGELAEIEDRFIVVEAGGVGYGINVPSTVIGKLPDIGSDVKIYTYFSVHEDDQSLFGFLKKDDREIFLKLLGVSGVGPKVAIGVLSALTPDELRMAVVSGDSKLISKAPGVGGKTAQRIILELKDKIDASEVLKQNDGTAVNNTAGLNGVSAGGPAEEAIDALEALGYSRLEAGRAVRSLVLEDSMTVQDILKAALKKIR